MCGPYLHLLGQQFEFHPHPTAEYPLWSPWAIQCPVCGVFWLHTSPGDYCHQQTFPRVRPCPCPAHGGTLELLCTLDWAHENPILIQLNRYPGAFLKKLYLLSKPVPHNDGLLEDLL